MKSKTNHKRPAKPAFLNVDLEIESSSKLDSLAAEMGEAVSVLHCGPWGRPRRYLLGLESARFHRNPDAAIHALCVVVERLSPAAQRVWNVAVRRDLSIGYDLRPDELSSTFALRPDTLQRVAELGASLSVTYYNAAKLSNVASTSPPGSAPAP